MQYIDARDLAAFAIDTTLNGAVNVLSRPGHTTMAELLALCHEVTGSTASFTWVDAEFLLAHDVAPWTELPSGCRRSATWPSFYTCDSSLALRSGLVCRSGARHRAGHMVVAARHPGWTQVVRANRSRVGMAPEREAALLAAWADQPPAAL